MALPAAGPGVVLELADVVPGDAGLIVSVTDVVGYIEGSYVKHFGGTAVIVQHSHGPNGPDVIEVQAGPIYPVDGVVTVTTQPLLWSTSTVIPNAIGGLYVYSCTVEIAGRANPVQAVFRFITDEQASYSLDGGGNVAYAEVATLTAGVQLPDAQAANSAELAAATSAVASDLAGEISSTGGEITAIDGRLTAAEAATSAVASDLAGEISATGGEITALDGRLTAAESVVDATDAAGEVAGLERARTFMDHLLNFVKHRQETQ